MARRKGEISRCLDWLTVMAVLHSKASNDVHDSSGMSLTQTRILLFLALYPTKTMGAVAKYLNLKASTVTAASDALEAKGLLAREGSDTDSRQVIAKLTDEGEKAIPSCVKGYVAAWEGFSNYVHSGMLDSFVQAILPNGALAVIEERNPDASMNKDEVCKRLQIPNDDGEGDTTVDQLLFIEKVVYSLNAITYFENSIGLTLRGARILRYLDVKGGTCCLRDLRHDICSPSNIVTSYLNNLGDAGFVVRESSTEDRRMVQVSLTKEGAKLARRTSDMFVSCFEGCFPELSLLETKKYLAKPLM